MNCSPRAIVKSGAWRSRHTQWRSYAFPAAPPQSLQVFNRHTKNIQKEHAARNTEISRQVDYLRDEVASRLCGRLLDINRTFPQTLDLLSGPCTIARLLTEPTADPARPSEDPKPLSSRLTHLTCAESAPTLLHRDTSLPFNKSISLTRDTLQDPELLPYDAESFDAVMSSLGLHWINDLPSMLAQVNNILKPDAPLLAAMLGGDTLFELRTSLQLASMERRGGVSQHTSPLADVRDVGGLLGKAGFKLLTVDVDDIVVDYPSVFALMKDLQAMGEQNALLGREMGPIGRDVLLAADGIYRELHGNEDGSVPATFRVIYMIAWKEGKGQAQPLARGSGDLNMKEILEGRAKVPEGGGKSDGEGEKC